MFEEQRNSVGRDQMFVSVVFNFSVKSIECANRFALGSRVQNEELP